MQRKRREREEPCSLCGHYHDYEGGEPCSICGHRLAGSGAGGVGPKPPSAFPTDVLPDFLYLGSYDHASRSELLKTLGIAHILNTVPACQNLYKNSFTYHTASASPPPFEECFDFLESVRASGGKVLVHCMTGGSRSPSVVMYYLMRHKGIRLGDAYAFVKGRRPQIALTAEDAGRLQAAEAAIFGPSASGFIVPVGATGPPQQQAQQQQAQQQPAAAAAGGGASSRPFGAWPSFNGGTPAAAAAAAPAFAPGQPGAFSFGGGGGAGGGFVFGQQEQQQAQLQGGGGEMME